MFWRRTSQRIEAIKEVLRRFEDELFDFKKEIKELRFDMEMLEKKRKAKLIKEPEEDFPVVEKTEKNKNLDGLDELRRLNKV